MSSLRLVLHEFRFEQKVFWRNPASVFFTAMLPVIFLVIFATIFGGSEVQGMAVDTTTYYIPAIITLAVVSAALVSLSVNVVIDREAGLLKRGRGTPLPAWVFIAGRVGNSMIISLVMLILIAVIGRIFYSVPFPWEHLPALLVALLVGAASFCCMGLALSAAIPTRESASPITNLISLPLYFLSGVFIPEGEIPSGVLTVAGFLPVRPFFQAFLACWDPTTVGAGFEWGHLAVVAAWGLAGLLLAVRWFRWTPRA
ncbi:MAG: ABC transporter permease [Solirubrobacterales bacterium]|nr:ABC transporter permease [Solirubrobacterales bacterium]